MSKVAVSAYSVCAYWHKQVIKDFGNITSIPEGSWEQFYRVLYNETLTLEQLENSQFRQSQELWKRKCINEFNAIIYPFLSSWKQTYYLARQLSYCENKSSIDDIFEKTMTDDKSVDSILFQDMGQLFDHNGQR